MMLRSEIIVRQIPQRQSRGLVGAVSLKLTSTEMARLTAMISARRIQPKLLLGFAVAEWQTRILMATELWTARMDVLRMLRRRLQDSVVVDQWMWIRTMMVLLIAWTGARKTLARTTRVSAAVERVTTTAMAMALRTATTNVRIIPTKFLPVFADARRRIRTLTVMGLWTAKICALVMLRSWPLANVDVDLVMWIPTVMEYWTATTSAQMMLTSLTRWVIAVAACRKLILTKMERRIVWMGAHTTS
mmetsp:Transcript_1983/g.4522  ORF Transcript_1983/g.4522 Transcript_1983/m.4522 type:complete len:246 (+) Transcript_1983:652-1389(+)